nr:RHS repeat-associated core domain-containing protein [Streptomyces sp. GbtcB6]
MHDFADDVSDALRLVKGMAGEDTLLQWAGKSAEVFKEQFKDVPKNLKKLKKSYEMCGDALADYWPKLERAQALADKALAKAKEAQADLSSAKSRLSSADSWVTRATKEADKYKDDPTGSKSDGDKPDEGKVRAATRDVQSAKSAHTQAQSDVTTAQNALDAAKKMAEDARKMRDDAAGEAKRKIDEASDAGIPNRHWWQDVGHWFEDNWDTIVTVCKVVVAVVGIIAMIIGGPILGAIVLVAALVVLADTLYKYSKGQASLWDVAFAAMDCIPGGKGITSLGKLAKGLKEMKNLRGGMKAMSLAVRGLGKNARGMLAEGAAGAFNRLKSVVRSKGSDPVDMATGAMYLPQTDIELPGLLPLAFTRRVASDYRCGWWFGPTWASTLDQRLEIDEQGIVHVTEDGLLLAYPHPTAPHAPVLPEAGPRRPLTRLDDGGYRITDPLTGHTHHFARPAADGTALLTRITDRNQHTLTFDHDEHGTPLAIRHSGGYHLRITTDEGRVTALSLADAADVVIKRYGYTDGNLTETVNSSGLPLRFTYDQRLRVTSWTDTNNSRYAYTYDDRDRCIAEGGEAGHITIALDHDGIDPAWPDCRITTLTTAEGAVTRFVINDNSQVIAETDPLGHTTRTTYDSHHHLLAKTDELDQTTRFTNNPYGQPTKIARPDGREIQVEYDDFCLPTRVVAPDGGVHRWSYDERGNRIVASNSAGVVTRFSHDDSGRLTSVTDGLGHITTVVCNRAGLPVEISDPSAATTHCDRDPFGRPVTMTDTTGAVTRLKWSVEGRLVRRMAPDGATESWTYDGEGNCISHVDSIGGTSHFEYTHFDLLTARTGPDRARYEFVHDAQLRLTEVVSPQGLKWTYEYDAAGRLVCETDFDDRTLAFAYDAATRLVSRTNALGQTIRFERNALGQVIRKDAAGRVTTYVYDEADRLAQAIGPTSALTLVRDSFGYVLSETVSGRTVRYEYDALGRRTARTTPSGARSSWSYDAPGNRTGMVSSGRSIGFVYDAAGRELTRTVDGALTLEQGYDPTGRLTNQTLTDAQGSLIQHRTYRYRADGGVIGIDDRLAGTRSFELDGAGRVTAVRAEDWTERYAYDEMGNQTTAEWPTAHEEPGATGDREYAGTRITRAGHVRYEHDALGRIILRQKPRLSRKPDTWRYAWDAEDRLTSVVTPDGTRWRYEYDPLGRRVAKLRMADSGEEIVERVDFTWDGTVLCEQTTNAIGLPNRTTLTWDHQNRRPIAQAERITTDEMSREEIDSRFFAIVTDLVGTPTELVDEQGRIAWHSRSTVWGNSARSESSTAYTPLRFPGQYYDPETALHYNYFRHYDPETARYLTADPLGLTPAPNPMAYVHDPLTWTDALGLAPDYPLGEKGNPFGSRADAEKSAFEVAGVPHGTTPDAEWVVMGDKNYKNMPGYVYSKDPTHWGNFRQFEMENGSRVIVEHTHDPAGPHFHAGAPKGQTPEEQSRNLVNFGWDNTQKGYGTMERYRALDKPGGDHHFFYQQ